MRTYKPVPKKFFTCACGCGRRRFGRKHAKYFETACRVKDSLKRQREAKQSVTV